MGSGLVYIIIVGMWISYFLPRWISNHDEVSGRSMERFASAMKVVGSTTGKVSIDLEELKLRKQRELISRRIIFLAIIGFTIIIALFTLVGLISPIMISIPLSSFALYLVHARHQIQTMKEEISLARSAQEMDTQKQRQGYTELIARSKRAVSQLTTTEDEQWVPLNERKDRSESESQGITILPKGTSSERATWQPTEIPAPTYSQSPKAAPRRPRIDLTTPGTWSEAVDKVNIESVDAASATSEELFDQEVAEQIDERIRRDRASNE